MDKKEFKTIVGDVTGKYGFAYSNKNYYCTTEEIVAVISLIKSNYDDSYYINYGFCVKEIHNNLQYPRCNECDIAGRFVNELTKDNYSLEAMEPEMLIASLEENINRFIVPVINDGIRKYFELFPRAMFRATLNLKEYLGQ